MLVLIQLYLPRQNELQAKGYVDCRKMSVDHQQGSGKEGGDAMVERSDEKDQCSL
jgi:hypothetical protein